MNTKIRALTLFTLVLFLSQAWAEYCPVVKNDPFANQLLYRISCRYRLPLPVSFYSQPTSVCDVLSFLEKADSLAHAGRLSAEETEEVRQLRKMISPQNALLKWTSKQGEKNVNVRLDLLDTSSLKVGGGNAGYIRGTLSPALYANLGRFSFYSGIDVWTDYTSDTLFKRSLYEPYDGVPYNLYNRADSSNVRASDMLRGGLSYTFAPIRLEAGIDRLRQGPAMFNPLTLSGDAPPQTYIRGIISFGIMDYTQTFGQLKSDKDAPKYFYMHRLSAQLFSSRLIGGVTEVVINGSTTNEPVNAPGSANALRPSYYGKTRGWEFAYIIPFIPYAFAEHYLGDKDNKALSFDLTFNFPDNFRWYLEFFMDDFTAPWSLLSSDWGNKWAYTVGGQYFGRLLSRDFTALFEYCRVEPWVYTHFYGGSHRYDNFDVPLGAPLGPNSDNLRFTCESMVTKMNAVGATFTNSRTNHSQRGGKITDVFQDPGTAAPDNPKKVFLDRNGLEVSTRLGLFWSFNRLGVFRATVKYEYDFSGKSIFVLFGGLCF
jgi:hypothetical protein